MGPPPVPPIYDFIEIGPPPKPQEYIEEIEIGRPPTNIQAFCDSQTYYIQSFCKPQSGDYSGPKGIPTKGLNTAAYNAVYDCSDVLLCI